LGVGIRLADFAVPENVVGNEEASAFQTRERQTNHARVVGLIDVVEDDVVLFLFFRKNFEGIA